MVESIYIGLACACARSLIAGGKMGQIITAQSFENALASVLNTEHKRYNIGTYSEGTLHTVLKYAVQADMAYHEYPVQGYIADVFKDGVITEIQTRDFRRLNEKLAAFLPEYRVNIVYPVACVKMISKLDEETGEMTKPRKSNKCEKIFNILPELYYIQQHLNHPNLEIHICLMEITEYRMPNPKRKTRMMRFDRVPQALLGVVSVKSGQYGNLLPCNLQGQFLAKDFVKESRITGIKSSLAIKALLAADVITNVGKQGRANIYQINE